MQSFLYVFGPKKIKKPFFSKKNSFSDKNKPFFGHKVKFTEEITLQKKSEWQKKLNELRNLSQK